MVTHSTFTIERSYSASPQRVFTAFADPAQKRRWFRESHELDSFESDFRIGGIERTRSLLGPDTPFPGTMVTNDTVYQDIVSARRIVWAYTMTLGEQRISASLATVELSASGNGTRLLFTEQSAFFEGGDGPDMRKAGWTDLLGRLGKELERA